MRSAILALALAAAGPAAAEWTTEQGGGAAVMRQSAGGVTVTFSCNRGSPDRLGVAVAPWRGAEPAGMMLWIVAPDGREARHSMDFYNSDSAALFYLQTSSLVLEQLRQAAALRFSVGGDMIAQSDARGTGAYRLAVREQCGF